MDKPNLDLSFMEKAAELLDSLHKRRPSDVPDLDLNKTLADKLRKYPRSFAPTAQNVKNRAKCIADLRSDRAYFALLSGEPDLEHFTHGEVLSVTQMQAEEKTATLEAISFGDDDEGKQLKKECVTVVSEFTRLIEELWKVPVV